MKLARSATASGAALAAYAQCYADHRELAVDVESDVTVDDLRALRRFFLRSPPGRDVILWEYFSVALAGFAPYFVLSDVLESRLHIWIPSEYVVGLALLQLTLWSLLYLWSFQRASRILIARSAEVASGHHRLTLSERGVHEQRPQGEISHHWSAVTAVHDQPAHIFIAVGPDGHYVVPKRAFPTLAAAAEFVGEASRLKSAAQEPSRA
jgi:hypothetical protein